jgi:hypothetical protein
MELIKFTCRVCKESVMAKVILDFTELLPPGLKCVECLGCGTLGVELIPDGV